MSKKEKKINFYASHRHYLDHMLPIWLSLPKTYKGTLFIEKRLQDRMIDLGLDYEIGKPEEHLTLVASFGDYQNTKGDVVYMEHGIGHTYSNNHPGYAGGVGKDRVVLFLNQHDLTQEKNQLAYPDAKQAIIGTPKMDKYGQVPFAESGKPVVCVSFHWDNKTSPESRTAYPFYKRVLPVLETQKNFTLVYHGHPREDWSQVYKNPDIEIIHDLDEVFKRADIYVCDNSSSMYEFLITGKPVIYLNCKNYRKKVNHGIRFWDYIAGTQVENAFQLLQAINENISNPYKFKIEREEVVEKLYPFYPHATKSAIKVLKEFLNEYGTIQTSD